MTQYAFSVEIYVDRQLIDFYCSFDVDEVRAAAERLFSDVLVAADGDAGIDVELYPRRRVSAVTAKFSRHKASEHDGWLTETMAQTYGVAS